MATVLVVEDKDSLRSALEQTLQAEGWTVVGLGNGSAAVERLKSGEKADLVLTDWRLPRARGLAGLAAAPAVDPTLPLIVMTALGTIDAAVDAMKRGPEGVLTEPC